MAFYGSGHGITISFHQHHCFSYLPLLGHLPTSRTQKSFQGEPEETARGMVTVILGVLSTLICQSKEEGWWTDSTESACEVWCLSRQLRLLGSKLQHLHERLWRWSNHSSDALADIAMFSSHPMWLTSELRGHMAAGLPVPASASLQEQVAYHLNLHREISCLIGFGTGVDLGVRHCNYALPDVGFTKQFSPATQPFHHPELWLGPVIAILLHHISQNHIAINLIYLIIWKLHWWSKRSSKGGADEVGLSGNTNVKDLPDISLFQTPSWRNPALIHLVSSNPSPYH